VPKCSTGPAGWDTQTQLDIITCGPARGSV
jgi:hypothetical protein